jgi:arabinose-5-phosphate isomerase
MDAVRLKDIIQKEANAISRIPITEDYSKAVDLVFNAVCKNGGKVICSGMGKAGQVAHNLATTLSSTGIISYFLHPSEAQHGDLGIIHPNDVLVVISNSGKTRELIELTELSARLTGGNKIICITGNENSPLHHRSDITLLTGNPAEVCPLGLTPTTSITVMTVICDLLVVGLMERTGFTAADYALRHHSGYLGQKARNEI